MLAHAFLAVATAAERDPHPSPMELIRVDRQRSSADSSTPSSSPSATQRPACWTSRPGADDTNTEPANVTTDAANNQ